MHPAIQGAPNAVIESFVLKGYRWRVARDHAADIQSANIDWLNLASFSGATLIKRNSRRDVWQVRCGDRNYFVKTYDPSDPLVKIKSLLRGPTAECEWNVGLYAASHGIPAVMPVATAVTGFRGVSGPSLLITEAVPDVEPLNQYWLSVRDDRHRANLLSEALARLIARAHQCGFRHGDMHPGNILVRPAGRVGEVLFVDLHDVQIGRSVSLGDAVANLAQLHQWFRRNSPLSRRRKFLEQYLGYRNRFAQASPLARNFDITPRGLIELLSVKADVHANRLWSKRDRRSLRSGSYFNRVRPAPGWRGHVLLKSKHPPAGAQAAKIEYSRGEWKEWLKSPLDWIDASKHQLIKDSHTATIVKATLPTTEGPAEVIVKRPLARNFIKRLAQTFGRSRNMRAWRMANRLLNRGLPVAQPLAIVERFALGVFRTDSIGFTDYIPGSIDIETFLTRDLSKVPSSDRRRVKDQLIEALVRIIRTFHDRGFAHRDLKAGNLLLNWSPPYDTPPRLTFIDMDGISHVRRATPNHRNRAIVRLCVSVLNSPLCSRTDLLRFLKRDMIGFGRTDARWKDRWRECEALVRAKNVRKASRRQWKLDHYGRE